MKTKLNKRQKRRVAGVMRRVERIRIMLKEVSEERITAVVDLAGEAEVDGYRSDTRLMAHISGGGSHSSPTETAALSRRQTAEKLLKHLERIVTVADVAIQEAVTALHLPFVDEARYRGRQGSDACRVCSVLPAEIKGFCRKDYNNWVDHGRPDPTIWEMFKRKSRNSEGILLVSDCPPPSPGREARIGPFREGWEPEMADHWTPGKEQYTL